MRRASVVALAATIAAVAGPSAGSASPTDSSPDVWSDAHAVDIRPDWYTGTPLSVWPIESFGSTVGSHVELINADAWHDAGIDGSGVTIGVIDFFDVTRYWDVEEHGPQPVAGTTAICFANGASCTDEFFDGVDRGGEDHGVAIVETLLDTAPGAKILIGQAQTLGDYRLLIDWFAAREVDIISRSLGSQYDGPGDGRGALDDIADRAVDAGMLWVNSGGNSGQNRYYRHRARINGNNIMFGESGDDAFLRFRGCVALAGVRWVSDWDLPADQRSDYDAYLWESPIDDPTSGTIVASGTNDQRAGAPPLESLGSARCPTSGRAYYLELRWRGGDATNDVIEILDYGWGMVEHTSAAGSAAVAIVASDNPGVLGVGAIDPANSATIASYSSQGPSNDGRVIPDLTAPANLANSVVGRFAGTSAAAPVVAGAGALMLAAGRANGPEALAAVLRNSTVDRGPAGVDNQYGAGELKLPDPPMTSNEPTSVYVGLDRPERVLDTRPSQAVGPPGTTGPVEAGHLIDLPVAGVTDGEVTAVAVNVVSVAPDAASYVQGLPSDDGTIGGYANLNVDAAGQVRSNFAVIPVGSDGSISLYTTATGNLVVDLFGYFVSSPGATTAGRFVRFDEADRVVDTRAEGGRLASGEVRTISVADTVDDNADALIVTVTATNPSADGWLQVFPTTDPAVAGATANLNVSQGRTVSNTAIVELNNSRFALTGGFGPGGDSHVVIDAVGFITSEAADASSAGKYIAVTPGRAYDSRVSGDTWSDGSRRTVDADAAPTADIPGSASAVVWNVATVNATRAGWVRTWATGATEPTTASATWTSSGETRSTAAISAVASGRADVRSDDGTANAAGRLIHVVVDVFGYFT